jgi:hypothetical protein
VGVGLSLGAGGAVEVGSPDGPAVSLGDGRPVVTAVPVISGAPGEIGTGVMPDPRGSLEAADGRLPA